MSNSIASVCTLTVRIYHLRVNRDFFHCHSMDEAFVLQYIDVHICSIQSRLKIYTSHSSDVFLFLVQPTSSFKNDLQD